MRGSLLYLVSAIVGGAVGMGLVLWLYVPGLIREEQQFGYTQGYARGQIDVAAKIPEALGSDFSKTEKYAVFHQVKDVDIVVVERNGVKTLRVYDDR